MATKINTISNGWHIANDDACVVYTPAYATDVSTLAEGFVWSKLAHAETLIAAAAQRLQAMGGSAILNDLSPALNTIATKAEDWATLQSIFTDVGWIGNLIPAAWNNAANHYKSFAEHWTAQQLGTDNERFENFCEIIGGTLYDAGTGNFGFRYVTEKQDHTLETHYPNSNRTAQIGDIYAHPVLIEDLTAALAACAYIKFRDPRVTNIDSHTFQWSSTTAEYNEIEADNTAFATYAGEIDELYEYAQDQYSTATPDTTSTAAAPYGNAQTKSDLRLGSPNTLFIITLTSETQTSGVSFSSPIAGTYAVHCKGTQAAGGFSALGSGIQNGTWTTLLSGTCTIGTTQSASNIGLEELDPTDFLEPILPAYSISITIAPAYTEIPAGALDHTWTLNATAKVTADWLATDLDISEHNEIDFTWTSNDPDGTIADSTTDQAESAYYGNYEGSTFTATVLAKLHPTTTGEKTTTTATATIYHDQS